MCSCQFGNLLLTYCSRYHDLLVIAEHVVFQYIVPLFAALEVGVPVVRWLRLGASPR